MATFLFIILVLYILYRLFPYILAFIGVRLIKRMHDTYTSNAQNAGRTSSQQSQHGRKQQKSQSQSPHHEKIFADNEGQYVDFEEV